MTPKVGRGLIGVVGFLFFGCLSPSGVYRELSSDKKPTRSDVVGTWLVTPASAKRAAATGLPLVQVQQGRLRLSADGSCEADIYASPCGSFSIRHYPPSEPCQWDLQGVGDASIKLTFGRGSQSSIFGVHHLASNPPLLWQYICDPDAAEFLEFQRGPS